MARLTAIQKQEIAYVAGFIDADGCITIERSNGVRGLVHSPRISGYNTDKRPLQLLADLFGGKVSPIKRKNPKPQWSQCYYWQIHGWKAISAARYLMPYLKRKSVQAYLISCFDYEKLWSKGGKPEDVKMPKDELDRRESLYLEMKEFNKGIFNYG